MNENGWIIEAKQLGRRFAKFWALEDVNVCIKRGETFGIVGADGAGKTTLLQLFAAILDPTRGRCSVFGFDSVRDAQAITSRIGYMPQGYTLYDRLTVAENIAFAAKVRNVAARDLPKRREPLLAMAGLQPFLHRREGQLSGGMRKKLALCTNMIHQPQLLLLDEPGLGVDPLSRRELWRMLAEFAHEGRTIVLATSYMDEAERCDRIAFLDGGHIIAQGSPAELRSRVNGLAFRVVSDDAQAVDALLRGRRDVVGIRWRADGVRLVVDSGQGMTPDLRQAIEGIGQLETAEPSLEDLYAVLRGAGIARVRDTRNYGISAPETTFADPAFATDRLSRQFGSFVAVDGVSLNIKQGEIFGLLGANGAGKTTLIRMLCGLLPPSAGSARVAGFDIAATPRHLRQRIGYMSQRFSLYPDLTAAENLAFFASAYGLDRRRSRETIDWAIEVTGLTSLHDRLVARLSGAIRQRIALACAILHRPAVLFLDEPTSGIDPLSRADFWRLINALAASGTTVVVTTHYLEEATYCHRLGLMHLGRLIAVGDLKNLRAGVTASPTAEPEDVFIAYLERESESRRTSLGAAS